MPMQLPTHRACLLACQGRIELQYCKTLTPAYVMPTIEQGLHAQLELGSCNARHAACQCCTASQHSKQHGQTHSSSLQCTPLSLGRLFTLAETGWQCAWAVWSGRRHQCSADKQRGRCCTGELKAICMYTTRLLQQLVCTPFSQPIGEGRSTCVLCVLQACPPCSEPAGQLLPMLNQLWL